MKTTVTTIEGESLSLNLACVVQYTEQPDGTYYVLLKDGYLIHLKHNPAKSLVFVEYIKSNKSQYIDTGINPTLDYNIECKAIKDTNYSLFGTGKSFYTCTGESGENYYYIGQGLTYSNSDTAYEKRNKIATSNLSQPHIWGIKDRCGQFDNTYTSKSTWSASNTTSVSPSGNLYLFARNHGGFNDAGSHTMYYCKIWDNSGVLVRDFKPCTYGGVPGMWDLVEGKFYGSASGTAFVAPN